MCSEMLFVIPQLLWVVNWVTVAFRSSNHSDHSRLPSGINKAISPTAATHWIFSLLLNPGDGCASRSAVSEQRPATSHLQVTKLLPCDRLIRYLCWRAVELVYLIKWPVSIYTHTEHICTDININQDALPLSNSMQ